MTRSARAERTRYQLLGIAFTLVVALFVAVTIASYRKTFVPVVQVSLETDKLGNQLQEGADVKVRGVLVGQVRSVRSFGDKAVLGLALRPERAKSIPDNVTARLLPKTLFGERYVALQIPERPATSTLTAGSVIGQDRSSAAIEITKVLDDIMPVLRAVQPQQLATTLSALSQALSGRGKQLGETLVQANQYLQRFNPSLPDLDADIANLAGVADTYSKAAPDLLQALSDLTTTSKTIVEQRDNLRSLYGTLTTTSVDLGNFLRVNQYNLIRLSATSRPTVELLAKYAPEYPCMLAQLADQKPDADFSFGKGTEHPQIGKFTIEITASRGAYQPGVDTPRYLDTRGPRCYPSATSDKLFPQYPPDGAIKDGSTKPPPSQSQSSGFQPTASDADVAAPRSAAGVPSVANSPEERKLIAALVAPLLGVMPKDVPSWSGLLLGPLFRGMEVTVR